MERTFNVSEDYTYDIREGRTLVLEKIQDTKLSQALYGLSRTLISNIVTGVSEGFNKRLQITGVGYRAQLDGKDLVLNMGYSHPVHMLTPTSLSVKVETPTSVVVSGMEKGMVGEFAAKIRSVRPPEPYKGKGIAYEGEIIRRKAGKTGK
jgi:large subunit ribosomal protein L6